MYNASKPNVAPVNVASRLQLSAGSVRYRTQMRTLRDLIQLECTMPHRRGGLDVQGGAIVGAIVPPTATGALERLLRHPGEPFLFAHCPAKRSGYAPNNSCVRSRTQLRIINSARHGLGLIGA